jgi:UPF0271 protein
MKRIDLNVDIGEGFPNDEALLNFATSTNICCGEHAGSWALTQKTVDLCLQKGKRIGMHPGFADRASMGRAMPERNRLVGYAENIQMQCQRFMDYQMPDYVKPHGAFYMALTSPETVEKAIYGGCWGILVGIYAAARLPTMLLGCPRVVSDMAELKLPLIREGFADRAYRPDGTLVPRSEPGAVLGDHEEIRRQVLQMAPHIDSICLHGDTPNCIELAGLVLKTLQDARYEVSA